MFSLMVQGTTLEDLIDQLDEAHRVLQQARPKTRRTADELQAMATRADEIGLRRAASEYHVSPSWLSRIRNGKVNPKVNGDATSASSD